jgi:hypothetical protein
MISMKKIAIPVLLVVALLTPSTAFAHDRGKFSGKDVGKSLQSHGKAPYGAPHSKGIGGPTGPDSHSSHEGKGRGPEKGLSIIQQTLFLLLAEKYSSDSSADWEATIAEHNKLREEIGTLIKANPKFRKAVKPVHTEDMKTKMEADKKIRADFAAAIKAKDSEKIKSSLAAILTQIKDRNKMLAEKLAALKKAASAATNTN